MSDKYATLNPGRVEKKVRQLAAEAKGALAARGLFMDRDRARLAALRDAHRGERAFLIGNGPSVRTDDLERLGPGVSFCFNRFYLAYAMTRFRPRYTLASDRQTISDFGQEIVDRAGGIVFLASAIRPRFTGDFIWLSHQRRGMFRPVYRGVVPGGGTLVAAVQVAWHMGIRDFVLYGVDHHYPVMNQTGANDFFYSASGEGNHFIPGYRSGKPWCPPHLESLEASLRRVRAHVEGRGGSVVNATRGGRLEIFERAPIEGYFE
ncbi:MAG TPA: hypothetical protein VFJ82_01390 [Longimicrobium sp.]|nr:hypothetical protein [Longimicrobium sp.]